MIHDVDESLRSFVRTEAMPGSEVDVVFDAPTKDWSSRRNSPTVDLYLYDIREDVRRREVGQSPARDTEGQVVGHLIPPRWFKLSYLVTAWTQRPEDEHRLLAQLLHTFLRRDRLPPELLAGSLDGIGVSIPYTIGLPPPQDRALSDVWSALGGELKPSLDLVVTAPFDLNREIEIGPPVLSGAIIDMSAGAARERTGEGRQGRAGLVLAGAATSEDEPTAGDDPAPAARAKPPGRMSVTPKGPKPKR